MKLLLSRSLSLSAEDRSMKVWPVELEASSWFHRGHDLHGAVESRCSSSLAVAVCESFELVQLSPFFQRLSSFCPRRVMQTTSFAQKVLQVAASLLAFPLKLFLTMIRRLTSRLSRDKKQEVNGNGTADSKNTINGKRSSYAPKSKTGEPEDHSASRHEVESSFEKYAQLIHASQRPLPTQSGDGAYLDHTEPSGLLQDLKSIGFKDIGTLMQVMKNKASGELQDDKTYMMEHVIQASRAAYQYFVNKITVYISLSVDYPPLPRPG